MRHSKWLVAALLVGVGASALTACQPGAPDKDHRAERRLGREPVRAIERLDCPERQGGLTRLSAAPDGQSCTYTSSEGTVDLRLIRLNGGDAEAALAPIEAELKGVMPTPPAPPVPPETKDGKNKTSIHLPGINIDAHGDSADIRIGHLTINSDGGAAEVKVNKNVNIKSEGGQASVNVAANDDHEGDVTIKANDNGAEIRAQKGGDAVRSTLILANDKAPKGYRLAGYEARGPKGGPLAVAVVKAKNRNTDDHDLFKDMKALVRHNVGG
ncbi:MULTISPECIES: hypothetical protein [unclassified Caulobacter]|uniref:hypothetical protein n=1 Tax=unclassified Caulobacter TaxID=2648921 RepID=UPI000783B81D|nr:MULTISPECIES: hypothetical protein [unclassified Caulobacter]AZS21498.1 hypothetical protein CSW63_13080 [Caulobacter sp. FWC26]